MKRYIEPTDEGAFIDFPPLVPAPKGHVHCPKCKGYGGWNLLLNQYRMPPGFEDTAANRHRYTHFRAGCDNCDGYGVVREEDADHIHDWSGPASVGSCLNRYVCRTCGLTRIVDSSD